MRKGQMKKIVILVLATICIQLISVFQYLYNEKNISVYSGINTNKKTVTTDEQVKITYDDKRDYGDYGEVTTDEQVEITYDGNRDDGGGVTDEQIKFRIKQKIYITDFDGKFLGTTDNSYSETPNRLNLDNGINIKWVLEIPKHIENRIHTIKFSEEINIPTKMEVYINAGEDNDSIQIGKVTFYPEHKAVIEFYSNDYEYSMIANFCLSTTINKDAISFLDDKFDLNFICDDDIDKISISFEKPQFVESDPEKIPAFINKEGVYDPKTKKITWTIITWADEMSDDNRKYKDLYIKDVLEPNQTYVEGSFINEGGNTGNYDFGVYSCENGTTKALVIKNLEFINDGWTSFKFQTKVSDSYIENGEKDKSISNIAYLIKENTNYVKKSPLVSVPLGYGYNFISKEVEFNDQTNIARWKINVNTDGMPLSSVKVKDDFPSQYLELSSDVLINGQAVSRGHEIGKYEYTSSTATTPASIEFNLGDISSEYIIEFETKVKPEYFHSQNFEKCINKVYLYVEDGVYKGTYMAESDPIYLSSNPVAFMILGAENFSYKEHIYRWQSTINMNYMNMEKPIFRHKFEEDLLKFREDVPIRIIKKSPDNPKRQVHFNLIKDVQNSTSEKIKYKIDENSINYYHDYDPNLDGHAINVTAEYDKINSELKIEEHCTTKCLELFYYETLNIDSYFFANNKYMEHNYKCDLTWDDGAQYADSIWPVRDNQLNIITNTAEGYDSLAHRINWKIALNKNDIKLKNAVISEKIPKGQKYVEGSFKIEKAGLEGQNFEIGKLTVEDYNDSDNGAYSEIMKYEFNDSEFEGQYLITFQTEITPDIYNNASGMEVIVRNTASIDGKDPMNNDTPIKTVSSTDGIIIPTTSIINTGEFGYDSTRRWIDWTIFFNMNSVYMKDVVITDMLEEGFVYDKESAKLYDLIIGSNGGYALGQQRPYLQSKYDAEGKNGQFSIVTGESENVINKPYALKFRTYITDINKLKYSNTAHLTASNILSEVIGEASKTEGIITTVTGGAEKEQGMIEIHNYDEDNHDIKLNGGVFEIYIYEADGTLKKIKESVTNDEGIARFYKLPYGKYYIKQIKGVKGYKLCEQDNIIIYSPNVQIINMAVKKDDSIVNNGNIDIIINKIDKLNKPLEGAEFGLFSKNNEEVRSGISDINGKITFINIPYGVYNLKEKKAPTGYEKIEDSIEILVNESTEQSLELRIENNLKEDLGNTDIIKPDPDVDKEPDSDPKPDPDPGVDKEPDSDPKPDPDPDVDKEPDSDPKPDPDPDVDKEPDSDLEPDQEEIIPDIKPDSGLLPDNPDNSSSEKLDTKEDTNDKNNVDKENRNDADNKKNGKIKNNNSNDKEINETEEKEINKKVKRYDNDKSESMAIKEKDTKAKDENKIIKSLKSLEVERGFKIALGLAGAISMILPNKYTKQGKEKYKPISFKKNKCHMFIMYYEEDKGWYNENIITERQFKLENKEDTFAYDDCFFQKIKVYKDENGSINLVQSRENLHRLNKIYKEVCIPKIDIDFITEQIKKLIKIDKNYIIRNIKEYFNINIGIIAEIKDGYIPKSYILYAKCEFDEENSTFPDLYITNKYLYLNYNNSKDMDESPENDSIIWNDSHKDGIIKETGEVSIMFVINDVLFINKLEEDIIPSVMRKSIIKIAKDLDIEVKEEKIPISFITESIDKNMLTEIIIADNNNRIKCVNKIFYKDKEYLIYHNDLFTKISERFKLIGLGQISDNHNWITPVK